MDYIVALQILSGFFMTGVIWVVQTVHYPTFLFIAPDQFKGFHEFHVQKISRIVMPIMILELLTAIALIWKNPSLFFITNMVLIVAIWTSTFLLSVPTHTCLGSQPTDQNKIRLVKTNWPRTILWTIKTLGWVWFLIHPQNF